ncbi:MAG TPA: hypothetical protein VH592_06970 [Gemmataceae bacterium]|jgi:hypothetical protein
MPAAPASRRSRLWIVFFVALAVMVLFAMLVPIVYNLSIQLRPEQVAEAQQRWLDNTPANYDLEYLVRTMNGDQEEESTYLVQVRGGQVVLAVCNRDLVYVDPSLALIAGLSALALSSENPRQFGVPALFDEIEARLHEDESAGRRNFATAQFDPKDGHPFHYVRRVAGTKERVEWNVKLTLRAVGVLPRAE